MKIFGYGDADIAAPDFAGAPRIHYQVAGCCAFGNLDDHQRIGTDDHRSADVSDSYGGAPGAGEPRAADSQFTADDRGSRYFQLAESYASAEHPPRVVAMAGVSGTGKSFVANALAARLGAAILSTDGLRRAALGLPAGAELRSEPNAGLYTGEERARVYASMRDQAGRHLLAGIPVILDATHATAAERAEAVALAGGAGVPLLFVRVTADDETVRARLAARGAGGAHASDADWAVYVEQLRQFEPLDECGPGVRMQIDGAAALTPNLDAIVERLGDAPVRA